MSTNIYQATYPQNPQVDLIDNNGNIHFYIPTINRYVTYHNTMTTFPAVNISQHFA